MTEQSELAMGIVANGSNPATIDVTTFWLILLISALASALIFLIIAMIVSVRGMHYK